MRSTEVGQSPTTSGPHDSWPGTTAAPTHIRRTTGREHKVGSSFFFFFLIQHAQNRTAAATSGFHERLYML